MTQILLHKAAEHKDILQDPEPNVLFKDFGDSALVFQLYFATNSSFVSNIVKSDLRYKIFQAFSEAGIEIPFPQRTLSFLNPPKALQ